MLANLLPTEHEFRPSPPTLSIPHPLLYFQCAGHDSFYTPFCSQSLPAQYTLATTPGFSLAHMNQAASIFHIYLSPPEDRRLPAFLQQLDLGEYQGHRVNDCFFFLSKFRGICNVTTGLSLPPFSAFPQSKMLSSHISGTAFVEKGTEEGVIHTANCHRSLCFSGDIEVVGVVTTLSL